MTGPNPDRPPLPPEERPERRSWKKIGLVCGAGLMLVGGGGALWAWRYIHTDLAPFLSETLTESWERPVELGEVEEVTPTSIRVGPSRVGATATDPTRFTAASVEVRFNLLRALLTGRLGLYLRVVEADGYLEQDQEKGWLVFETPDRDPPERELFKVEVRRVTLADSRLQVIPYPAAPDQRYPIDIEAVEGQVNIDPVEFGEETAQQYRFELEGDPVAGGSLDLRGEVLPIEPDADAPPDAPPDRVTNLEVEINQTTLPDVLTFTLATLGQQQLPVVAEGGQVSGQVKFEFRPDQPTAYRGTVQTTDGVVQLANLPQPLTDVDTELQLRDSKIYVDAASADLGDLSAVAEGVIDLRQGYDLTAEVEAATVEAIAEIFELELPIALAGTFDTALTVTGPLGAPVVAGELVATEPVTVDRLTFGEVESDYVVSLGNRTLVLTEMLARPEAGGVLTGQGEIDFSGEAIALDFDIDGENLPGDAIAALYELDVPVTLGAIAANTTVTGTPGALATTVRWQAPAAQYPGQGVIRLADGAIAFSDTTLAVAGGTLSGSGTVADGRFQADLRASGVPLNQFSPRLSGLLAGNFDLAGPTRNFSLSALTGSGSYRVQQFASGTLAGTATVADGRWRTNVNAAGVALSRFTNGTSGQLSGDFQLTGGLQNPSPSTVIGQGSFRIQDIAAGSVTGTTSFSSGRWQANVTAAGVQLARLAPRLQGQLSGQAQLSGRTDTFSLRAIQARGNVALGQGLSGLSPQLAGFDQPLTSNFVWNGQQLQVVSARSSQLQADGVIIPAFAGNRLRGIERLDLAIAADRYPLAALPVALPGAVDLGGLATFDGRLSGSLSALSLVGDVELNQFALNRLQFDPPLAGTIRYRAGALDLDVAGGGDAIALNYSNRRSFDFFVDWRDATAQGQATDGILTADINQFPLAVIDGLPPSPLGPIRGTLSAPNLRVDLATLAGSGDVRIDDLALGYVDIDQFAGTLRYAGDTVTLTGGQVQFANSFYELSGSLDLVPLSYTARVTTDQGRVEDVLAALSIFELSDFGRRLGTPTWVDNPLPGEAVPVELATEPAGDPSADLDQQLRRLAELQELDQIEQAEAEQAILPPLSQLSGEFTGRLELAGDRTGTEVDFRLDGDDWRWGSDIQANTVIAEGRYADGVLALAPLRLELPPEAGAADPAAVPPGVLNLAGQFNLTQATDAGSNLQLVAESVPVETVRDLLNLPVTLDGRLNGAATFGGSIGNPQVRGNLALVEGSINRQPIDSANAQFLFQNAQLTLLSTLTKPDTPEPLQLNAQIPYAFDFMTVEPASENIVVDISVEDEGLALLSVLTRAVTWESGQGSVELAVRGTLSDPQIRGFIDIADATIGTRFLPEPITITRANASFVQTAQGDQLVVRSLTGQFSDGSLQAAGILPLGNPIISARELAALGQTPLAEPDGPDGPDGPDSPVPSETLSPTGPLTVELDNIALALVGRYQGSVDGRVVVGGSLNPLLGGPQLGGRVLLSNGQIFLPDGSGTGATTAASTGDSTPSGLFQPRLQQLNIALDRSTQIVQGDLLRVFAEGTLQLTGPLANLSEVQPVCEDRDNDGENDDPTCNVIRLRTGRVNLFTSSFRLAGNNNTARFIRGRGLQDPILNVELRTSVAEATGSRLTTATAFATAEVADTTVDPFATVGSIQTVRIRASVDGPASQIFQNLTLTSSPPRSRTEIIGLLGGSFISAVESGGSGDLGGVVNFFGGALLNRIQDFVATALNLSEFRLFPVTAASRFATDDSTNSGLDIGTEIGFDVTEDFTISILKILTDDTPPQYNLRYQLTDELRIRAITDLDDDNRIFLEFETRF